MKEAYGGIVNLVFIAIFLTIIIGVLGFVFSYTKAFKVKNSIIDTFERYEGSGCTPELSGGVGTSTVCRETLWKEITEGLKYHAPRHLSCPRDRGWTQAIGPEGKAYFCYKKTVTTRYDAPGARPKKFAVYRVMVQVDIEFPIIDRMTGMNIFQVAGDTEEILLRD